MPSTSNTSQPRGTRAASDGNGQRPRGRPRLKIDRDAVANAVAELFDEGGYESVSISATADKLSVSRATLYRTVPTKQHLLGILLERTTREVDQNAREVVNCSTDSRDRLYGLVHLQIDAAIRMRGYLPLFFGSAGVPSDVYQRWHSWVGRYEKLWTDTVKNAMDDGVLERADPTVTTRLLLGMCLWVSRWYRPNEPYRSADIADAAVRLIRTLDSPGPSA